MQPAVSVLTIWSRISLPCGPGLMKARGSGSGSRYKNIWNEVKGAQKIVELVRSGASPYQDDIVVLAGDMEAYGGSIKRAFFEYGIPLFMDDVKRSEKRTTFWSCAGSA